MCKYCDELMKNRSKYYNNSGEPMTDFHINFTKNLGFAVYLYLEIRDSDQQPHLHMENLRCDEVQCLDSEKLFKDQFFNVNFCPVCGKKFV